MRIVDRKAFLELPSGTLFSKYEPCVFDGLHIKGSSIGNGKRLFDFFEQDIAGAIAIECEATFSDALFRARDTGESIPIDLYCEGRDGCFNDDQLFAVWELPDVKMLIRRLGEALESASQNESQ